MSESGKKFFNFFKKRYWQINRVELQYNQKGEGKTPKEKEIKKMSKTEIIERINKIENSRFYLSMKDRWDSEDYAWDRAMVKELVSLKKSLEVQGWKARDEKSLVFLLPYLPTN